MRCPCSAVVVRRCTRAAMAWGALARLCLLLVFLLPGRGSSSSAIQSSGKDRFVVEFGEQDTAEDLSLLLGTIQDDEYACWLDPRSFSKAVCIQNRNLPDTVPETAAELRRTLQRVNLRSWLPDVLCPQPPPETKDHHDASYHFFCHEVVDEALMASPPYVHATIFLGAGIDTMIARASVEDMPWLKAMEACMQTTAFASQAVPYECKSITSVLSSERATLQLLPALRTIAAKVTADPPFDTKRESPSAPSATSTTANRLLALLEGTPNPAIPYLRMDVPKPGGRTSGEVVAFVGEVNVGTPPVDRPLRGSCEVRFIVDGAVVDRIPIEPNAETKQLAVAVTPVYPPRCSEHPAHSATMAAAGGAGRAWDHNPDMWCVEAREIEKVCTQDAFGLHRMHAELACCSGGAEEGVSGDDTATAVGGSGVSSGEALQSSCEVIASAAPVEYFHTANGAAIPTVRGEDYKEGEGSVLSSPLLLDPPPEDITVSLHLDSSTSDDARAVVSVPRWSSDGDVWEAAFEACSKSFGPESAILVELNDCVDLVTSAVRDNRVDLYNRMVLHLEDYIKSADPAVDLYSNTAWMPEKVEALGAMPREGGDRVDRICEVGFNAGHSSLNWLLNSPPSTRVLAFDLGATSNVRHALAFLQAVFPGRLELILGDSADTVPAFALREEAAGRDPRVCSVVLVDGDHSEEGVYTDLVNFQALTSRTWHQLAMDDMDMGSVYSAWRRFKEEGQGYLERTVHATAEHYVKMEKRQEGEEGAANKHTRWDVLFENKAHRVFLQRGHWYLGIGSFLLPPLPHKE